VPKRCIVRKRLHKSKLILSTKKIAKRKLKKALQAKTKGTKAKRQAPKRASASTPQHSKSQSNTRPSPAKTAGRPSRFDETEEAFLRNVPEQLKQYAFRPGHKVLPGAGRPKGSISLTTRLRGLLATPIEGRAHPKGKAAVTYADELMSLALQAARRGDYRFFDHIYSRVEGKIPDHVVIEEVQRLVGQESAKLTEELVTIVAGVAKEEFGEKRAQVFSEKLTAQITEKLGEKDAGRRAS